MVGLATPDQVEAAAETGLFATITRQAITGAHFERFTPEQQSIVAIWNAGLSPEVRELRRDRSELGKSWGAAGRDAPGPSSPYDVVRFRAELLRHLDLTEAEIQRRRQANREEPLTGAAFVAFERRLAEIYGDATIAYHLARLAAQLGPGFRDHLANLDQEFLNDFFEDEPTCWKMEGEIAVGVIFVESSRRGGPTFSSSDRSLLQTLAVDGLDWLAGQAPIPAQLTWVYDWQFLAIDVENKPEVAGADDFGLEAYWRNPAMGSVSFNGATYTPDWPGVGVYREDLRRHFSSKHAMAVFITPYANPWHGYAGGGRITLANHNDWGNWGIGTVDEILAHEVCHLFGAADEYVSDDDDASTPCSSCAGTFGCYAIPNGNCGECGHPQQDCIMSGNDRRLCAYTQGQIGWADLFVETTTGDVDWAGTDDTVWLDIGDRTFNLDTPNHDDRERGNVEGYALNYTAVTPADIKRVGIRKSEDGDNGGWRLQRVRLWNQGSLICDEDGINTWLEDDTRWWASARCGNLGEVINQLLVEVTTGDVAWAGTDDDVRLTLGGRSWDLDVPGRDDFERGDTNGFDLDPGLGLYRSMLNSIRIHKSPDGSNGGWRLGGLRIVANGQEVFNNQQINQWLEDDNRDWFGTI